MSENLLNWKSWRVSFGIFPWKPVMSMFKLTFSCGTHMTRLRQNEKSETACMNLTIFKSFELSLGRLSCPQLRKKVFPQMLRTSNLNYLLWNWINKINGRTTGINIIYHINCVYMCVSLQAHYSVRMLLLLSRFSHVRLCATPWIAAYQAPPSMGFSGQQYWSGVPLPSPKYCYINAFMNSLNEY